MEKLAQHNRPGPEHAVTTAYGPYVSKKQHGLGFKRTPRERKVNFTNTR